jgi:hypothetical protein
LSSLIVVRERGVSKSSISHCEKSARELKAKEWRISREESKKYSKREGLSLGTRTTRTTRTIDLRNTRDLLLDDDDKENYDEIFFCYYYRKSSIQKRKDFKAKSVRASFAALSARLSGYVRALDPSL